MEWKFALYLFAAMILAVPFTWSQTRRYTRALREMADIHNDRSNILVSGRGRGKIRGAVVMLVINAQSRTIVEARVMAGASVFAPIRRNLALEGPADDAVDRAGDKMLRKAVAQALEQFDKVCRVRATATHRTVTRSMRQTSLSTTA